MSKCMIIATPIDYVLSDEEKQSLALRLETETIDSVICRNESPADASIIDLLDSIGTEYTIFIPDYEKYGKRGRYVSNYDMVRFSKQYSRRLLFCYGHNADISHLCRAVQSAETSSDGTEESGWSI